MSAHTEGRLVPAYLDLYVENGGPIAKADNEADARRLAACWNACEGVTAANAPPPPSPQLDLFAAPTESTYAA